MEESATGVIRISNTESRISELCGELEEVLTHKFLRIKTAQRLRGRMQFADSQVFGKAGKRCMRILSDFSEGRRMRLQQKDCFFLRLFRDLLKFGKPREVRISGQGNVLIFTDACYERGDDRWPCGIGGVLYLPDGYRAFFSVPLDERWRNLLGELSKKQIIFEAETLAAVVALHVWHAKLASWRSFLFVDNEGCKFALMKGLSDNAIVDKLAEMFVELEMSCNSSIWLSRVPSKSNVADHPSRGSIAWLLDNHFLDHTDNASTILETVAHKLEEGRRV